ncbi:hypothetical protein KR009_012210 [Drosophila setifemur]|nr:hypothetical protein KR009_012210 [Drosophila setifemur]
MLLLALAVIGFGLAQTLPIDEAETTSTSEMPDAGRVVFDQRQTGRFNIHVSIKDVAIIEVGQNGLAEESYNDEEDYYYDDSALTVKPIKLTTEPSSSTTTNTAATASPPPSAPPLPETTLAATTNFSSKPKSKNRNNLMIVETPIGGSGKKLSHHPQVHGRTKDVPIMAAAAITPPPLPESIEYTPPQGHNSPIFKVKVQRSSNPTAPKKPSRCRSHQVRDGQGKCSDSIYRKLYSMFMGLNFPFLAAESTR